MYSPVVLAGQRRCLPEPCLREPCLARVLTADSRFSTLAEAAVSFDSPLRPFPFPTTHMQPRQLGCVGLHEDTRIPAHPSTLWPPRPPRSWYPAGKIQEPNQEGPSHQPGSSQFTPCQSPAIKVHRQYRSVPVDRKSPAAGPLCRKSVHLDSSGLPIASRAWG